MEVEADADANAAEGVGTLFKLTRHFSLFFSFLSADICLACLAGRGTPPPPPPPLWAVGRRQPLGPRGSHELEAYAQEHEILNMEIMYLDLNLISYAFLNFLRVYEYDIFYQKIKFFATRWKHLLGRLGLKYATKSTRRRNN